MHAVYLMVNVEYLVYENNCRRDSGHGLNVFVGGKVLPLNVVSGIFVPLNGKFSY